MPKDLSANKQFLFFIILQAKETREEKLENKLFLFFLLKINEYATAMQILFSFL